VKRALQWSGVAFLLFVIAYRPETAVNAFSTIGSTIAEIGRALGNFVTKLIA
jgi:hypothetical protein